MTRLTVRRYLSAQRTNVRARSGTDPFEPYIEYRGSAPRTTAGATLSHLVVRSLAVIGVLLLFLTWGRDLGPALATVVAAVLAGAVPTGSTMLRWLR